MIVLRELFVVTHILISMFFGQALGSTMIQAPAAPITENLLADVETAGLSLLRIHKLFNYFFVENKAVLEAFDKKKVEKKVFLRCHNDTCKLRLKFGGLTGSIMGKALKDVMDKVASFDDMKKLLEESVEIMTNGTVAQMREFMGRVAQQQWLECAKCHGKVWDLN